MGKTRRIAALLLSAMFLFFALPIQADVIWEPEDDFYFSHSGECQYLGESYLVNGEAGYASIYSSPKEKAPKDWASNGTTLFIHFTYERGGIVWGLVEYSRDEAGALTNAYGGSAVTGWLPLTEMEPEYNSSSFWEEFGSQIQSDSVSRTLPQEEPLVFWTYPGSGEVYGKLESWENPIDFSGLYMDETGLEWGYVGYFYGYRSCWVCLSDPGNESLPATVVRDPELYPAASPAPGALEQGGESFSLWIIVLPVALVALGTAALIAVLGKRRQGKK